MNINLHLSLLYFVQKHLTWLTFLKETPKSLNLILRIFLPLKNTKFALFLITVKSEIFAGIRQTEVTIYGSFHIKRLNPVIPR